MSKQTILFEAIAARNKEKILDILRDGDIDLKVTDDQGNTLLHMALRNGEFNQSQLIEILEIFLDRGLDITAKNKLGRTILHLAVAHRMRDIIEFCLKRNADSNIKDHCWDSIAHFAIEEECRKYHLSTRNGQWLESESSRFIDWMLSQGIDFFHKKNVGGYSALYLAAELNLQQILYTLMNQVTDLAPIEKDHKTPLLCVFLERINGNKDFIYHDPTVKPMSFNLGHYSCGIVEMILEKNKFINDQILATAMHSAIRNKAGANVIKVLLQRISSVDHRHTDSESLITTFTTRFYEIEDGLAILRTFILKGADLNEHDHNKETVWQRLFRHYPTLQMLELLKEGGADFRSSSDDGESCLHFISHHGNEPGMIGLVMNDSCDVNARDNNGETPLQLAIVYANEFVALDLIEHGAKVNDVYKHGTTPLSLACVRGRAKVVEKLIERGADLGCRDANGKGLLHLAVDNPKVVELLIKSGMDLNARDKTGKTPIHHAKNSVFKVLVRAGAYVDTLDNRGNTPLYYALSANKSDMVSELVKCGADIRESKVFALALIQFQYPYNLAYYKYRYIKQHLVKLTAVGLLDEIPYGAGVIEDELQRFYEQCQAEVSLLKNFLIDDSTSLYKFLLKNPNRRCIYVNNEKLKAVLDDTTVDRKFFKYYDLILGCYNGAVARKPILEKAMCVWEKIVNIYLPDLCIDNIFMYLSNMDLQHFVEASENLNSDSSSNERVIVESTKNLTI